MRSRHVFVYLGLLALFSFGGATAALAQGGGSAGNQQYTDPFGSTKTSSHTSTQSQGTSPSTTPATTTPATTTPAPTGTAAATTTTPSSTDSAATTVATAASGSGSGNTLPFTGINVWTVAGLGLTLTAFGLLIRLRSRA